MSPHPLHGAGSLLKVVAFTDGAARRNPGPAGRGVHMATEAGEVIEISGDPARTTDHVAEYAGLVEAAETAAAEGATERRKVERKRVAG